MVTLCGYNLAVAMDTSYEMMLFVQAAVVIVSLITCTSGEIRCYCNDASCVRTGYMCKSPVDRCFSQLTYERDSTRSIHGCVESLHLSERDLCEGSGNIAEAKTGQRVEWPILLCCKEEMCNYMDKLDINIYVTKSNGTKEAVWRGVAGQHGNDGLVIPGEPAPYPVDTAHRDLWFKAAVIAVPIAGGFILVMLVLLAIRVLKNDNRRHRQLIQMRQHRSVAKAQLYVADHFYHNELLSETCPKCDNMHCTRHYDGEGVKSKSHTSKSSIHSSCNVHPSNGKGANIYRDVHIKLDHSKNGYEKMRPVSDGSTLEDTCDSIVLWGDKAKSGTAAPV